jgi:hypothetical protein
MQSLLRTLQDQDLGRLRILAELWGLDLSSGPTRQAAKALSQVMLDPILVNEIIESLTPPTRQVLDYIYNHDGRIPLSDLIHRFGPLREMGPGRRDREKPWRNPASPIEILWYRGLIARAFTDTQLGPREFAFIPTDLLALFPQPTSPNLEPHGFPINPPPITIPATSTAVDDAITILAALRRQPSPEIPILPARRNSLAAFIHQPAALDLLITLLYEETILVTPPLCPDPQSVRSFIDSPRSEALRRLLHAWKRSTSWNELQHIPYLTCATETWPNAPFSSRQAVFGFLSQIPLRSWWDLEQFVASIRELQPGFQRPAGDFDSWYLRDTDRGTFLRGFEHWDAVDGAILRFIVKGPLHWLGAADLGKSDEDEPVTCFRLTPAAAVLFDPKATLTIKESTASAKIQSNGQIIVPRRALRALRYQIARFTSWELIDEESYNYRLSPSALSAAAGQGLQLSHIFTILETAGDGPLPISLRNALQRWSDNGSEAWFERHLLLRVNEPAVLNELQENKATSRYLGEILGPTSVTVNERDLTPLCAAAARLGILIEPPSSSSGELS